MPDCVLSSFADARKIIGAFLELRENDDILRRFVRNREVKETR